MASAPAETAWPQSADAPSVFEAAARSILAERLEALA